MMDYMASRDAFLDVGEQYINHLGTNIKEWHKFVLFYSDVNNERKSKDDEYRRDQFIGEELDWKMLADNLSLFQSQAGDLKDLQGFDPNGSLQIDQSIMQDTEVNMHSPKDAPLDRFNDQEGENFFRNNTVTSSENPGETTDETHAEQPPVEDGQSN